MYMYLAILLAYRTHVTNAIPLFSVLSTHVQARLEQYKRVCFMAAVYLNLT